MRESWKNVFGVLESLGNFSEEKSGNRDVKLYAVSWMSWFCPVQGTCLDFIVENVWEWVCGAEFTNVAVLLCG